MPGRSSDTVETILDNPDAVEDEPEEIAEVTLPGGIDSEELSPRASDYIDMERIDAAPSVQAAREAAHIPPHFPMKELVGETVTFVHKRKQKAALPDTGELREGYFCLCVFTATKKEFTTWVGQTILTRELTLLQMPFTTTIVRRGRTYIFQ